MLLAPFCRFFVNLIKKSLTICLWSADQKRFVYSLRVPTLWGLSYFIFIAVLFFSLAAGLRERRREMHNLKILPYSHIMMFNIRSNP